MEVQKNYSDYYDIIRKIKSLFECKYHLNNKYTAYCNICKVNLCEKCLSNNLVHIGHKIFYFEKISHSEKQIKYYSTIFYICTFYLKRIREIIIEILSDYQEILKNQIGLHNYSLLLKIQNQLKKAYKNFYKINIYQLHYTRNILEIYKYCIKCGYINFQIIKNVYDIRLNSVKIPDLSDKDIISKIKLMIDFMNNKDNNILKSFNANHPSTFYSYIEAKNPKYNSYDANLSTFLFEANKSEIYIPSQSQSIISNIDEDNPKEDINIKGDMNKLEEVSLKEYSEISNITCLTDMKDEEDLKNINNKLYNLKENLFQFNNNINNHKIEISYIKQNKNKIFYEEKKYIYNSKNKKNKRNINIIEKDEKPKNGQENNISSKEKIKKYIYENLPQPCNDNVEYKDNIQYIYLDKNEREIKCVYHGEFKKGTLIRHGRGLFLWEDGEFYLGYWANDKREGEGMNTYKNGNLYKGNYKNGKKEGDGIYRWNNGDKYSGKWKNDMKDGKGIYKFSSGDIYKGDFKNDKIDGDGAYTWANKITFKGKFKNNSIDKSSFLNRKNNEIKKKERK